MNAQRKTWTLTEDLPDPAPRPCTIEDDQKEFLGERIGWGNYWDLEFKIKEEEDENSKYIQKKGC